MERVRSIYVPLVMRTRTLTVDNCSRASARAVDALLAAAAAAVVELHSRTEDDVGQSLSLALCLSLSLSLSLSLCVRLARKRVDYGMSERVLRRRRTIRKGARPLRAVARRDDGCATAAQTYGQYACIHRS